VSRGAGFANADLDVNIARDTKFRRLSRLHPDLIMPSFAGYVGILAECWGCGERKSAIDAWPEILPWSGEAVSALQEVGLLDAQQKLPQGAWRVWYGAACERRERRRQAGSIGGKQKASNARAEHTREMDESYERALAIIDTKDASSTATATLEQSSSSLAQTSSKILPVRPSVRPSNSPIPPQAGARARARRTNGQGPRQLRDGSDEIDRRALTRLGDLLPKQQARTPLPEQIKADTAALEDTYANDPEHWIERAGR
jgi:hypothetical protein